MKDTTKKEITKEELKEDIRDIVTDYFDVLDTDKQTQRHLELAVDELATFFESKLDRIREDSVREYAKEVYKATEATTPNVVTVGELNDILMRTLVEVRKRTESWWLDDYLKSKSGGKE